MGELINIEKILERGSLRWLGDNYNGRSPQNTVIAGKSISSISKAMDLPSFKFERFSLENFFVVHDGNKIFYAYANPKYSGYRNAFGKLISGIPANYHVDHVLSRNLATHFGYSYVLLCIIPGKVNSRHGHFEKIAVNWTENVPEVCFSDNRVYNKILSRNPTSRQKLEDLIEGFKPVAVPRYGLTLKQGGIWNTAFGFDLANMNSLVASTYKIRN